MCDHFSLVKVFHNDSYFRWLFYIPQGRRHRFQLLNRRVGVCTRFQPLRFPPQITCLFCSFARIFWEPLGLLSFVSAREASAVQQKCNKITLEILVNYFKMQGSTLFVRDMFFFPDGVDENLFSILAFSGLVMEFRTAPILSTLPADLPSWVVLSAPKEQEKHASQRIRSWRFNMMSIPCPKFLMDFRTFLRLIKSQSQVSRRWLRYLGSCFLVEGGWSLVAVQCSALDLPLNCQEALVNLENTLHSWIFDDVGTCLAAAVATKHCGYWAMAE